MKLFLTSSGISKNLQEEFKKLLGKNPKDALVGFIPTAKDPEKDQSYVQWTFDQLDNMGMKYKEVDLKGESEESLYEKLKDCDVILVNGGNTNYLLDWTRKSGFDKTVKRLIDEGKVYVGVSAGTLLACPDISISAWKSGWDRNVPGITDFTGFGWIDSAISPHYKESDEKAIVEYEKETGQKVLRLRDKQAVVSGGKELIII